MRCLIEKWIVLTPRSHKSVCCWGHVKQDNSCPCSAVVADMRADSPIFKFDICRTVHHIYFYNKTNQMYDISNLFRNSTLHVSDGLSVHHQESKTVHTASGMCHTGSVAAC